MKKYISALLSFAMLGLAASCSDDFMDTSSTEQIDESQMFASESNALMAINGMHNLMHENNTSWLAHGGYQIFMLATDMMCEDMVFTKSNPCLTWFAQLSAHQDPSNRDNEYYYSFFYRLVSNANKIIRGVETLDDTPTIEYVKGQALAYRAFCYFNLVQMYGSRYVADTANTQPACILRLDNSTSNMPRASVEEVYAQINADLDEAIALLDACGVTAQDKSHITVWVARGLKARVLLTQGRYEEAASMAHLVIQGSGASLDSQTYLKTDIEHRMSDASSSEWLWAKVFNYQQEAAYNGTAKTLRQFHSFISNSYASYNRNTPRCIYNHLYAQMTETDTRRGCWLPEASGNTSVGYFVLKDAAGAIQGNRFDFMSNKFLVPGAEFVGDIKAGGDVPYMRLPEIILIKAEALARLGRDDEAAQELYPLAVSRDPQYTVSTKTGQALIDEIMIQRRLELWGEGFRWFDLKRLAQPLDRGPKPREGYSQGGWKAGKAPTNVDPLASNYNMYDDQLIGEDNRYRTPDNAFWQWLFPNSEVLVNKLLEQNPLQNTNDKRPS